MKQQALVDTTPVELHWLLAQWQLPSSSSGALEARFSRQLGAVILSSLLEAVVCVEGSKCIQNAFIYGLNTSRLTNITEFWRQFPQ